VWISARSIDFTWHEVGTTARVVPIAHSAHTATVAAAARGLLASIAPAAMATGKARIVSPRNRSSVVRAPKGASQSSFR
jgi:hypothetical protein